LITAKKRGIAIDRRLMVGLACESRGMRAKSRDYMMDAIQTFSRTTASDRDATGKPLAY
jgi:hypothetical protein